MIPGSGPERLSDAGEVGTSEEQVWGSVQLPCPCHHAGPPHAHLLSLLVSGLSHSPSASGLFPSSQPTPTQL